MEEGLTREKGERSFGTQGRLSILELDPSNFLGSAASSQATASAAADLQHQRQPPRLPALAPIEHRPQDDTAGHPVDANL